MSVTMSWRPIPPRSGAPLLFETFANEVAKSFQTAWASKVGVAIETPLYLVFYLGVSIGIGRGRLSPGTVSTTLVGVVVTLFFYQQVNRMFWGVLGEMQSGTFEQLRLSPAPSSVLLLGRQIATTLESIVVAAVIYVPVALITGVRLPFDAQVLLPMVAVVVGSAGFSLVIAGLTLVFKRIEVLVELLFGAAFVAGGAFVPLDRMPQWLAVTGRLLFPVTQGIEVMRDVLLRGQSLGAARVEWGMAWLVVQPLLFVALGVVVYRMGEVFATTRGTLGRY